MGEEKRLVIEKNAKEDKISFNLTVKIHIFSEAIP